jgi:hypothetical protein
MVAASHDAVFVAATHDGFGMPAGKTNPVESNVARQHVPTNGTGMTLRVVCPRSLGTACLQLVLPLMLQLDLLSATEPPAIAFLTQAQARLAIVDETLEPYFSLLQTQEMACKTMRAMPAGTLESQRAACRRRYADAVGSFSEQEQTAIRTILATVLPHLQSAYPLFAMEPWQFIKLDQHFEGGMPHTRGHCIILSDAVLPGLVSMAGQPVSRNGAEMLVHEQTHVVQRLHPVAFARLYTEVLGFVQLPQEPTRSTALIAHQLLNPDGIRCVWAHLVESDGQRQLIEPQVILGVDDVVPRMPDDFSLIALPLDAQAGAYHEHLGADGKPVVLHLEDLTGYVSAFAPCDEYFHPNEICAVLLSRLVVHDVAGTPPSDDSPCMHLVRGWAATDLSAAAEAAAGSRSAK